LARQRPRPSPRFLQLGVELEEVERVVPEGLQPGRERPHAFAPSDVEAPAPVAALPQGSGALEDPQVLGHRPEGDVPEGAVDLPRASLTFPQQPQDLSPPGCAERVKENVHHTQFSNY
jgi:hypothetical protein